MYSAVFKEDFVFVKLYLIDVIFDVIFDKGMLMVVDIFMTVK